MSHNQSQQSYPWEDTIEIRQWDDTRASNNRAKESYSLRPSNRASGVSPRGYFPAVATSVAPARAANGMTPFDYTTRDDGVIVWHPKGMQLTETELYDANKQERVVGSSVVDTDAKGTQHIKNAETHVMYFPHKHAPPAPVVQATQAPSVPRRLPPPPASRMEYRAVEETPGDVQSAPYDYHASPVHHVVHHNHSHTRYEQNTTHRVEREHRSSAHRPQDVIPHHKLEPKRPAPAPRPCACAQCVSRTTSPVKTQRVVHETTYVPPPQKYVPAPPAQQTKVVTQQTVTTKTQPTVEEQQVVYMPQQEYFVAEAAPVVVAPMMLVAAPMVQIATPMVALAPVVAAAPVTPWY